jgi:hypothetical protein
MIDIGKPVPATESMLHARTLPPLVTAGLALAGLGLVGMTADELPGIPERLGVPAWSLGALGGALAASAVISQIATVPSDRTRPP